MDILERFSLVKGGRLLILISGLLFSSFQLEAQNKSDPFKLGEKMTYSMNFGLFEIGKAEMWIDPEIHILENAPHYLIRCVIVSSPWFRFFSAIDICMESYVRIEDLKPTKSFRDIRQGRRIDVRHDTFKYGDTIKVHAYIEDIDTHRYHDFVESKVPFLDALSTYLWLRSQDLSKTENNLEVRTFFSNDLYEFEVEPLGPGKFQYNGKNLDMLEFRLNFPESGLIPKGKSGSVIVSADKRQVPLNFKINMTLGSFILKLEEVFYE